MNLKMTMPAPAAERTTSDFRYDINFLRAIAVLSVVAYHFHLPIPGGFVGVDIFFVISGYLMTRIIARGLEKQTFSVTGFYAARIFRIVPALAVMVICVVLFNAVLIDPVTTAATATNALASLFFVSNVLFGLQNNYFAGASEENWLLHTWSLSVEWQFYLVYPLVMMLVFRSRWIWQRRLPVCLISTIVLFFATVILCSYSRQFLQMGFFLLPTRAWELLAGGCVAFLPAGRIPGRTAVLQACCGLVLIALSFFILGASDPWPSVWTALPVVGSVLLLSASTSEWRLWRMPGAQRVGLWSYSIYLWHWPVVVTLSYFGLSGRALSIVVGLLLTVAMAGLSYHYIETGLRQAIERTRFRQYAWTIGGVCLASLLFIAASTTTGFEAIRTAGLPETVRAALVDYRTATQDWQGGKACPGGLQGFSSGKRCSLFPDADLQTLVIGDSHAEQFISRFADKADPNHGITFLYNVGCAPLPGLNRSTPGSHCPSFTTAAYDYALARKVDRVVIFAAWAIYFPGPIDAPDRTQLCLPQAFGCSPLADPVAFETAMTKSLDALKTVIAELEAKGVAVFLVLPYPSMGTVTADELYRGLFRRGHDIADLQIAKDDFLHTVGYARAKLTDLSQSAGATLVDPANRLCTSTCNFVYDHQFLFRDAHHFRDSLARSPLLDFLDAAILDTKGQT